MDGSPLATSSALNLLQLLDSDAAAPVEDQKLLVYEVVEPNGALQVVELSEEPEFRAVDPERIPEKDEHEILGGDLQVENWLG